MNFIIDFYKELDTLNMIIFWGVIIVIILLLIFSILLINKNKKLKMIIMKEEQEKPQEEFIPIIKEEKMPEQISESSTTNPTSKLPTEQNFFTPQESLQVIKEEENFIAEEHVMEYNKELFSLSNIKKANEKEPEPALYSESLKKSLSENNSYKVENNFPNAPYQKNVLREMSLGQTSPIGIVKPKKKEIIEENKANELASSLKEEESTINDKTPDLPVNNPSIFSSTNHTPVQNNNFQSKEILPHRDIPQKEKISQEETPKNNKTSFKIEETPKLNNNNLINKEPSLEKSISKEKENREEYFKHLSQKMAENVKEDDGIDRTAYELQQEENAIISYEELMQKKDTIQIVDEEDAVISIEELIARKKQEEKLYHLTEDEGNDTFINELKHFRSDL